MYYLKALLGSDAIKFTVYRLYHLEFGRKGCKARFIWLNPELNLFTAKDELDKTVKPEVLRELSNETKKV